MANDGQIVFEVTADGKHAIADIKDITRAIQQETGKWDSAAKQSADNIESNFSGMLKKLAAGFSAVKIGKALLDIGSAAVSAASDLAEVQNVVDVTFGENANKIEKWAKDAGTQFGLTETQAKRFSSTMGAMLKSSGLAGDEIVNVSTDLAGLAADMASFYNLDFDEAFSKIRSGISGQTMPLKELGIDMSVATLNAFALQQGLTKTFDQMSQGEQTMLRYQYLMQATADAQGDFSRTSDQYANGMRKLQTNVETLKTELGNLLVPAVNEAVQWLNGVLESITSDGSKRTVLDDFAEIDLNTEGKLEQIRQTASEARLLTEELERISSSKAQQAGSAVTQMVNGLQEINLDQSKTGVVKDFLNVLSSDITTLAAIQGTDADGAAAWLANIGEAAKNLDPNDAAGWESLLTAIKEGLPDFENTDFGSKFFAALGDGFATVGDKSSVLSWAVDALGSKTERTEQEQALWLETCKRLVQTIPGLSSIINTETGEIKGGTQAVKDYIKAWEDGQTKLALLGALSEKESALSTRFSNLPELQLDMALAKRRAKKAREKFEAIWNAEFDENGNVIDPLKVSRKDGVQYFSYADYSAAKAEYEKYLNASNDATKAYQTQADALEEAKQALEEYRATIDEMPGTVEQAVDESNKYWEDNAENIQTVVNAAADAIKELNDYVANVRSNVESSIDSTVKGFGKITTPMQEASTKTHDLTEKLTKLGSRTKKNADEWDKLNQEINKYNTEKITAGSMAKNLQEQAKYIDEYLANLNKARNKGVSNEVLAQLSDGSAESYDYLAALAEASPEEVEKINASYQSVIDKKKELTGELTEQQLTVDQTYQTMAEKAKQAVDALKLAGEAGANTGETVSAIATAISDHVPEVKEAVDQIIAQLERLNGWGISLDVGAIPIVKPGQKNRTEQSFAGGSSFIPHDMVARLHEGERVLTAQENRIYTALMNGGVSGVDLDSLGGVMRDNVKAGGSVYLDGKIVGDVISDRQGRAYKSLQRSGWQA